MNEMITAAIMEDEKPAARVLMSMISELRPEWNTIMLPGNIDGAVEWFASHEHPDLLFLDIQLSDGNSFLFIEQADPCSSIIFTTAYDEYAVKAFTVNSIDYLLKPIHKKRLEDAILKYERNVLEHRDKIQKQEILDALRSMGNSSKQYRTRFLIGGRNESHTLFVDEVAYFHTEEKIVYATDLRGKEHMIDLTLNQLSDQLDPDRFFRANRQTIVNIDAVTKIKPYFMNRILVHTSPEAPNPIVVSREKAAAFKEWLDY